MPESGDGLVHLVAGQLATFTGFCTLHNLDLQFVGVGQVPDGHAKAGRGDLLDGGALGITIGHRFETCGVLATFTGVGLAAQAVHCDGQCFMGLGGDGAEAHGAGTEALHDVGSRFNLADSTGFHALLEIHQPAQCRVAGRLRIRMVGELPVGVLTVGARRDLQVGDRFRVPHVAVTAAAPMEVARVWQQRDHVLVAHGIPDLVALLHLFKQHREIDALHPAGGAHKAAIDDVIGEAHGFEDLRAFVGLQGGDAHLGHHLQHALGDSLLVGIDNRGGVGKGFLVQQAILQRLPHGFQREVGVDRVRAVTDEQAVVMHFARLTGFENDANAGAFEPRHQMMVYRAAGDERAERHSLCADVAIGQDDEGETVPDSLGGLITDPV